MLLDKTGTITESVSEIISYYYYPDLATSTWQLKRFNCDLTKDMYLSSMIKKLDHTENETPLSNQETLFELMSSCHSLIYNNGIIEGDLFEQCMFKQSGWKMETPADEYLSFRMLMSVPLQNGTSSENTDSPIKIGIIKINEFSSNLKRMSVVAYRIIDETCRSYAKGSPEAIKEICLNESLPSSYDSIFSRLTEMGYRVVALAYKELPFPPTVCKTFARENLERDMIFLGFLLNSTSNTDLLFIILK